MKIAILGFGLEGHAAYDYWGSDNDITICDQNPDLQTPDGVSVQLGDGYLEGLERFDLVVRSPYIHPRLLQAIPASKITSNLNEFMRVCPSRNIIGVTGTKGKGTTSTLLTKMLESAGKRVHLGGNIGIPALDLLKANIGPDDYVVLELSSYQLIDCKQSPHIAVCLLVAAEHLDWHEDLEEYIAAKQQLFIHQSENDIAIYYPLSENSESIADGSVGQQLPYCQAPGAEVIDGSITIGGQTVCATSELKLLGEHNWQNACAALTAAWQVTQDAAALRAALTSFAGLPHRIEFVRECNGLQYYNDSFSSGLLATAAAAKAIAGPKVVIMGGYDRMLPLEGFAAQLAGQNIRRVLIIGASAERFAASLQSEGFRDYVVYDGAPTMTAIVQAASELAESGDAIVLSPGFASFDMFKNFEDRGEQYKKVVNSL